MVYKAQVPPAEITRRLPVPTPEQRAQNFVPWENRDAKHLHEWKAEDYSRLNLPPELKAVLPPQPKTSLTQDPFQHPYENLKESVLPISFLDRAEGHIPR